MALDLDGGTVREARIALGGVATIPWRAQEAEAPIERQDRSTTDRGRRRRGGFRGGGAPRAQRFKVELGKRTLIRALHQAAALEI